MDQFQSYLREVLAIIERLSMVLGFHSLSSFIVALLSILAGLAFILTGAIFLIKKRRERKKEILKAVRQVQQEQIKKDSKLEAKKVQEAKKIEEEKKEPKVETQKEVVIEKEAVSEPLRKPDTKKAEPKVTPKKSEVKKEEPREPLKKTELKEPLKKPEAIKEEPKAPLKTPEVHKEEGEKQKEASEEKRNVQTALEKTRSGFMARLAKLFGGGEKIGEEEFLKLEEILFTADIGTKTADKLLENLRERANKEKTGDASLKQWLKEEMLEIFNNVKKASGKVFDDTPKVIMFVGVNGAGKTTCIAKLGARFKSEGKKVVFAAGDTFRAAAVRQLEIWGERIQIPVISGKENADSASVIFNAIEKGKNEAADAVLCDTAGRLHTKSNLMDELKKVHRVAGKAKEGAPHEVYLVIDSTMGQNAIMQAKEFTKATPLSGVILTKLDGTAKGGVALGIVDELNVPICYVGVGEKVEDLKEFNAKEFIDALFLTA